MALAILSAGLNSGFILVLSYWVRRWSTNGSCICKCHCVPTCPASDKKVIPLECGVIASPELQFVRVHYWMR
jgi:hypothetical protein